MNPKRTRAEVSIAILEVKFNRAKKKTMKNLEQIQTQIDKLQKELDQLKQVKQSKPKVGRFVPELGEQYWYCGNVGDVYGAMNDSHSSDLHRISTGNCFETEQEAQNHIDKLKFITEVQDWLDVQNDGWVANWGDKSERKWMVSYNWSGRILVDRDCFYFQYTASHKHAKSQQIILDMIEKFDNQKLKDWWV